MEQRRSAFGPVVWSVMTVYAALAWLVFHRHAYSPADVAVTHLVGAVTGGFAIVTFCYLVRYSEQEQVARATDHHPAVESEGRPEAGPPPEDRRPEPRPE